MEITHNHNAKSQLAKLLATENITVQHKPDAKTAWFDVKNRVLCLPVWREMSDDLYDLLVVHEVGHALDTPADGWLDAIKDIAIRVTGSASSRALGAVKGFLNVIEDARIDKRQKRRFPGARRNYVKGYAELIEKDFFGTKSREVNSMTFIDRLNIYCKGGAMLGIKFSAEEKKLLARVEAAETFEEVLALTEEIFAWSKDQQEEQEQEQGDFPMPSDEDGDGEGDDSDDYSDEWSDDETDETDSGGDDESDDSDDDSNASEGAGDADGEGDDSEDDNESSSGDIGGGSSKSQQDGDTDDVIPESETEKAWQKNQEDLIVQSNEEFHYVHIPRPTNFDKLVIDYKQVLIEQRHYVAHMHQSENWKKAVRADLMKFRADENASISYMVKEFEMRKSADEYSRTSISKTGVIDTNKLHSYKYNDDLFRRITSVATGKNHGFVMFIDWSGSMQQHMKKTLKQLFSLVMFCKRVQIPFEVYSFRSMNYSDYSENGHPFGRLGTTEKLFTTNTNELMFDNMQIRNLLSSRMKIQELNDAMYHLWLIGCGGSLTCDDMSSTPLNECIGVADLIVNKFRARSKVQICNTIFLTDGQSDPIYGAHGGTRTPYGKRPRYILQDEITKKSYDIRNTSGYNYQNPISDSEMTALLLRVLKDRVGGNLIGFYINGDGFEKVHRRYGGKGFGTEYAAAKKSWLSEGFFPVSTAGYDEYYILNPKTFNVTSGQLVIDSNATKNKMAKEFIKYAEKKTVSRVLLSRFVKRIAA